MCRESQCTCMGMGLAAVVGVVSVPVDVVGSVVGVGEDWPVELIIFINISNIAIQITLM